MDIDEVEFNFEGIPVFSPPNKLPKKSPLRFLSIDKLSQGEEILPKDFVLVFSPDWMSTETQIVDGLYEKVIPVIGVCGKVVFLNAVYQNGTLEKFLLQYNRK